LDEEGKYEKHILYKDKLAEGFKVTSVCDGSNLKADRPALRSERRRIRDLAAISRRHEERQKLRKELEPEAKKLRFGRSVNAEIFSLFLKAYGIWETIPPRRKHTIKTKFKCLQYEGDLITLVFNGKDNGRGILPIAKRLLSALSGSRP